MYNPVHKSFAWRAVLLNFAPVFTERPCCGGVASADVGPLLFGPCGGGARNVVAVVAPAVGQKNVRRNGRREGKALAVVAVAVR